jgi:hypothetical protein
VLLEHGVLTSNAETEQNGRDFSMTPSRGQSFSFAGARRSTEGVLVLVFSASGKKGWNRTGTDRCRDSNPDSGRDTLSRIGTARKKTSRAAERNSESRFGLAGGVMAAGVEVG